MNETQKCADTSSNTIQSSLPPEKTSSLPENDKSRTLKRRVSKPIEDEEGEQERWKLYDLKLLTFPTDDALVLVDVWHATPEQFDTYVQQFVRSIKGVNRSLWPLGNRLHLLNVMWTYAQEHGISFPFTLTNADGVPVPNVVS